MKQLLLAIAATLLTLAAFGQGQINFNNANSIAGWSPVQDRHLYFQNLFPPFLQFPPPVSSNYNGQDLSSLRVALYYAASTVNDLSLFQPAAGGPATFKVSTSATAGSWFGGTRTLNGIANGVTANLFVVVWDSNRSADPLSVAATGGPIYGRSPIFQYTPPTSPTPSPAEFLPNNLASFFVYVIPEPSILALVGLGATGLWILRRRR